MKSQILTRYHIDQYAHVITSAWTHSHTHVYLLQGESSEISIYHPHCPLKPKYHELPFKTTKTSLSTILLQGSFHIRKML